MALPRVLAIPRNIDALPPDGAELFTSVFGVVPNDGAAHQLAAPAGAPPLIVNPNYRMQFGWVRAEWTTVDVVVPPPLTLTLLINGTVSLATNTLTRLMLQAVAEGTPAIEAEVQAEVQPNARVTVLVTNTGTVSQVVSAYLWGWGYPQTLPDGVAYGRS